MNDAVWIFLLAGIKQVYYYELFGLYSLHLKNHSVYYHNFKVNTVSHRNVNKGAEI